MPGVERAPGTCAEPGCAGIPVAKGRCRAHLVWPKRNPDRADGRTVRNLRDRLARRDGYRCRHPDASERTCTRGDFPLEVHHRDGDVRNDALDNLELRCRRHNPRGGGLHKR
jgi:HNH endonuclease